MASKKKSPAKKKFCVWADYVRRVYQQVDAISPKAAYRSAKRHPEFWLECDFHDSNGYRLSNEVQDLATDEFITIHRAKNCRTCGSEIVETINDSFFRDGECGACEYQRYQSQRELLAVVRIYQRADTPLKRIYAGLAAWNALAKSEDNTDPTRAKKK